MSGPGPTRLAAINCVTCGSPLPALAGHRAKALICNYCGSVMDKHDDYRLLAQYRDMTRPEGPFEIGQRGELFGVEHIIVGIIGVEAVIEGGLYEWTNYQLYAPTHGYSWMTWNDGHLTHTRRTRDIPDHDISRGFALKAAFSAGGRSYRMFERYDARTTYIEGELTWVPRLGDVSYAVEAIDPPYGFALVKSDREQEYEKSIYLDRDETLAAFGVETDLPRPSGVHAIQPFIAGRFHEGLAKVARYFIPIAGVIAFGVLLFGQGGTVATSRIDNPARGGSLAFELTDTKRLTEIRIETPVRNAWAWYDLSLVNDETDEVIAEFDAGVEYYEGYEDGESWSEGSTSAVLRFRPPVAGNYSLYFDGIEKGSANLPVNVTIREGVMLARYPLGLLAFCALMALSLWLRQQSFERRRWGDGDDGEDDD